MGLGMVELAALAEEMGRALVPGAFLSTLLAGARSARGRDRKQASGRDRQRREDRTLSRCSKPSASWDPDAVRMPALVGEKLFVPDAAVADFIVVAARDAGELALYLVDGTRSARRRRCRRWI